MASRFRATPLTVVKAPPMYNEEPSEAMALTVPLVSATNGSDAPLDSSTAIRLARVAVWLLRFA